MRIRFFCVSLSGLLIPAYQCCRVRLKVLGFFAVKVAFVLVLIQ